MAPIRPSFTSQHFRRPRILRPKHILLIATSLHLRVNCCCAYRPTTAYSRRLPPRPTVVELDGVAQSYPVTLMSKLFSSVPKRERALDDVSLTFGRRGSSDTEEGGTINVLVGRSGSGKSTLLRLLSGVEEVMTSGTVTINGERFNPSIDALDDPLEEDIRRTRRFPRPVILDRKLGIDDSLSVMERIVASATGKRKKGTDQQIDPSLIECVAADFSAVLGLSTEQLQSKSSTLTPSAQFLFGIACGCVESVLPTLSGTSASEAMEDGMFYPILLLDELFDFEHPDVPKACGSGLENLVALGGVVVIATHKPHHWEGVSRRRIVTLSSGRVLTDEILVGEGRRAPIDAS